MKGLRVEFYSLTASFRDPNTHLYQETMPAPPPTTIAGIVGAAFGIEYREVLDYFKKNVISVGCMIEFKGEGKDLWNYSKIKGKQVVKDILIREFLSDVNISLYFACENLGVVEELYRAFQDPCFAITLGNSDDLAIIKDVQIFENIKTVYSKSVKNTWLNGNYMDKFELDWERIKSLPIKLTIKPPVIKKLPVDFKFNKNQERESNKLNTFTFLGELHLLKEPVETYRFDKQFIPMYTFKH